MLKTPEFMRAMKRGEEDAVEALLLAAFEGREEADLVAALRQTKAIAGEMVLPMEGEIIGYGALSKMVSPKGWLALAPVAIHPEHQGRGFGKRLTGMITQWAQLSGQTLIVLGEPSFYGPCGFTPLPDRFTAPFPHDYLMTAGPLKTKDSALIYPKAFGL